ncbi:MAG: glycosyltransferase, partial [Deltaproteobacteria bacterium]
MTIALLWLAAACGYWIVATRAVNRLGDARASEGSPAESTWRPTVVLARPLRGAPRYLRPCLASLLEAAARADAGVCLGLASRDDPAAAVAEELRRGSRAAVEIRSDPLPPGENRKIANLVQALAGSNAEVVVLSDADILVPPDYVPTVIAPLADASVGLTTCPYRSVPARTVLSRIDALLTNTRFLPSTCLAIRAEGLHFALGATIA